MVSGGKGVVKRVTVTLIRRPVGITSSQPQPSGGSPDTTQQSTTLGISTPLERESQPGLKRKRPSPTCDEPGVALLLDKFIDAFRDMPPLTPTPMQTIAVASCVVQRPSELALRAFKILEVVLLPCAEDLERIEAHLCGNDDIETSQCRDISPLKHGLMRMHNSFFVKDSYEGD